jgi:hypothetical protein
MRCWANLRFRSSDPCGWRSPTSMTNWANNISILLRRGESSDIERGGEQRVWHADAEYCMHRAGAGQRHLGGSGGSSE